MKHALSRRELLKLGSLLFLFPKVFAASSNQKLNDHLGKLFFGSNRTPSPNKTISEFFIYDLDTGKKTILPSNFSIHSFEINPKDPNEILATVKWGREISIYDLKTLKKKRIIKSDKPEELFAGHGIYSPDGNLFYASMSRYPKKNVNSPGEGFINVYEVKSGKKISDFSSHGYEPHEMVFFNNGKSLLILHPGWKFNSGKNFKESLKTEYFKPSICLVEIDKGTLEKKIDLASQNISLAHLQKEENGNGLLMIGGKVTPEDHFKAMAFSTDEKLNLTPLNLLTAPMESLLLSPFIDPKGKYACATSPVANQIFFWDFQTSKLVNSFSCKKPSGVSMTRDNSHWVIVAFDKILLISSKDFSLKKTIDISPHRGLEHCLII